jgi:hypothetical protein
MSFIQYNHHVIGKLCLALYEIFSKNDVDRFFSNNISFLELEVHIPLLVLRNDHNDKCNNRSDRLHTLISKIIYNNYKQLYGKDLTKISNHNINIYCRIIDGRYMEAKLIAYKKYIINHRHTANRFFEI